MKIKEYFFPRFFLVLFCVLTCFLPAEAQKSDPLKFNKDKTFKIAQFTDIHWDNNSENCPATIAAIEHVLKTEKPDLVILTGDIVTAPPAVEGWKSVTAPFIQAGIPWAVTLGNHDAEPGISRDEIFELLETLPGFVGEKGPELTGVGNYALPVYASHGEEVEAVIYCIDSNAYTSNKKHGSYDWVHFDQIGWYRDTSREFTRRNNGMPLPALTFMHIPLPEYKLLDTLTLVGERFEGIASPMVNSGLFASMLEMKDVMGVFVGHDHANNYIGIHQDIALAFGQVSGLDAYGDFDRGSRIIELKEGDYAFDTWIRTGEGARFKYNYPSGLVYDYSQVTFSPSVDMKGLTPGVAYKYYEGDFSSTGEALQTKVVKSGVLSNFSLEPAEKEDYFAFEFTGYLKIDKRGVYKFYTYSDDGSQLFIDGTLVVDNDGSHSARRRDGQIALEEGFHEIRVAYFESYMGEELEVGISGISIRETTIPDQMLYRKNK